MCRRECELIPRNIGRGEVTNLGRFISYAGLCDARVCEVYHHGRYGMGRVSIDAEQTVEFHPHPNLLTRFAQCCRCRSLAKIDVSAWKGPLTDLGLYATPQQKNAVIGDYETSSDQLRAGKMNKSAAVANLESLVIR